MQDSDSDVRDWATFGLGTQLQIDSSEIRDALGALIDDRKGDTAGEALVGLGARKDPRAFEPIAQRLKHDDVGNLIVEAAAQLADARLLPDLYRLRDIGWEDGDRGAKWLASAIEACEGRSRVDAP